MLINGNTIRNIELWRRRFKRSVLANEKTN